MNREVAGSSPVGRRSKRNYISKKNLDIFEISGNLFLPASVSPGIAPMAAVDRLKERSRYV